MADETPKSSKVQKQTFSSPYFLNSSDSPGNSLVSCPLKGENYPTWRRAMSNALRAKNKFGFVDGSIPKLDDDDPDAQAWDKCNSMVISWLFNSLVPELLDSVAYLENACDVWTDLEERFSQGNAPRIHELKREIAIAQQGNLSVAAYYTKLKGLWDELGTYSKVPKCSCGAAKEFVAEKDEEKLHQFLMGLNDCYSIVRSQILSMDPLPGLNKAYALVTREEKQQALTASRGPLIESATFIVKNSNIHGGDTNKSQDQPPTGKKGANINRTQDQSTTWKTGAKPRCDNCKKVGHTKDKCFELIGYPAGWQNRGSFSKERHSFSNVANNAAMADNAMMDQSKASSLNLSSSTSLVVGLTHEQYDQLMSLLPKQPSVSNFVGKSFQNPSNDLLWIIDSGASDHMTCHKNLLLNPNSSQFFQPVQLPNGSTLHVDCSGDL